MTTLTSSSSEGSAKLYYKIGDVAKLLGVKAYVLRYWESEFSFIHPQKSSTGQRVYKRGDVESLYLIKYLLYTERYSVEGARKRLSELKRTGEFKEFRNKVLEGLTREGSRIEGEGPQISSSDSLPQGDPVEDAPFLVAPPPALQQSPEKSVPSVSTSPPSGPPSNSVQAERGRVPTAQIARAKELLAELQLLTQKPITDLFKDV
ncbi:MAG: MerR family transcriptional regulator [Bdellovibrio sp.]|nr:MerR family transcriptional regulator [Bdellovibrio sp.]